MDESKKQEQDNLGQNLSAAQAILMVLNMYINLGYLLETWHSTISKIIRSARC